ncbi:MAG: CopG family transcriptional regulator [Candidatus Omnitrophota bacterium]|jgi:Arc/MetJ-type ribon-helix-helix transcriptional regulator
MENDIINVALPKLIIEKINNHIRNTEFNSAADYITFVLKEVLGEDNKENELTLEEEEQVKLTLKKLGYLKSE